MKLEIEHGSVQDIAPVEKNGTSSCRINNRDIKLHRDLVDNVKSGEDIMVAGIFQKNVFRALALKDIARDKVSSIDCTNYVLLMGLGIMLFIMFGIFGMQETSEHNYIKGLEEGISFAGLALSAFLIRHILRINRAVSRVS